MFPLASLWTDEIRWLIGAIFGVMVIEGPGVEVIDGEDVFPQDLCVPFSVIIYGHRGDIIIGHFATVHVIPFHQPPSLIEGAGQHTAHHGTTHIGFPIPKGLILPSILLHHCRQISRG